MDVADKIGLLHEAAQYDQCQALDRPQAVRMDVTRCISPAIRSDGRRVPLLKVLQSSICSRDCAYCAFRSQRDTRRVTLSPDELARTFDELARRRLVEGLFLSSGVCGHVAHASERMLATVELLRERYGFRGYIHLKILPGAEDAIIERSVLLADRVSVNLEAPNARRIKALSGTKDFRNELLRPLIKAHEMRLHLREQCAAMPWHRIPGVHMHRRHGMDSRPEVSMTTQLVVGAAEESDREILATSDWLYRRLGLSRIYYSRFAPVRDTPLENHPATAPARERRLYQADFLLRQYGFEPDELVCDDEGHLPEDADPKVLWARAHPERFPVEVNTAPRDELLRVPGIGPVSADRIVRRRRQGRLTDLQDAGLPDASARRASPYVLVNGKQPTMQLALW